MITMTLDLYGNSTIARLAAISKTIITMTLDLYGNNAIRNDRRTTLPKSRRR